MSDILVAIGAFFTLIIVTFFVPFIAFLLNEHGVPECEEDYLAIFVFAWLLTVIIATATLGCYLSMQKELDKYENQVRMDEPQESEVQDVSLQT